MPTNKLGVTVLKAFKIIYALNLLFFVDPYFLVGNPVNIAVSLPQ